MKSNVLDKMGRIPTYKVQEEYDLLNSLQDSKPSKRIIKTRKGLKAIKALVDIEKNHNVSWYRYLKDRNKDNMNALALFYRGTKITFKEMFDKADEVAKSMLKIGLKPKDEIGVCVTNSPELVYIILAANKLGIKVNCFGAQFDKEYLSEIIDGTSNKAIFVSDDVYSELNPILSSKKMDNIIMTSLTDSLPKNPELCDEYESELDKYYHYENKVPSYKKEDLRIKSFNEFVAEGTDYRGEVEFIGDLETDFLITYTSGSTKIGHPKALIHRNRSLITSGRFHDPELCGNPKIPGLRGLAHIHPDSNTDIITCISDNLMQGWSVALEPEYDKEKALDYVILNKPNYLNITTSFLLEMAKEYLIDKKFHKDGVGRKLPFLLATFAVGEGTKKGEEKFVNKFLREAKAGSGVSIKGFKLPFTTLSIGGGDCEHGGIYYTLWKALYQKLYAPLLRKNDLGLFPVPYANVTALKQDNDGNWIECDFNESGMIVANSYTSLSGYKNNPEATKNLIVEDSYGRKWITCNVYGYIDKVGSVHVKGRIPNKQPKYCQNYVVDDIVCQDTKNILSSQTVEVEDNKVITLQFQPLAKINKTQVISAIYQRLNKSFSSEILENFYVRVIPTRLSFPLTGSGKRSEKALEELGLENCDNLSALAYLDEQSKILKRVI